MRSRKIESIKKECEICGCKDKKILHIHHIIPRADNRCTDNLSNLACLCPNCHHFVHTGDYIIIGVYFSTAGRTLMFFKKGDIPPLEEKFWKIHPKDNPLVVRKN